MDNVKQRTKKVMPVSPGRPKGIPNKVTGALKDMILAALDESGGVDYLVEQAKQNPGAFMTLIGKVLPLQVTGPGENGEHLTDITIRLVRPSGS